ncbi:hypothetical protein HMPREF1246_0065 [Acidaminococcus sp. BV3L6]|nr:hypothetical protein HMPREF1246_0065 [Acidaminococcus sp. BV3L6]
MQDLAGHEKASFDIKYRIINYIVSIIYYFVYDLFLYNGRNIK